MADIFQVEQRDLARLIKFYRRAPKPFSRATAGVINTLAFGARKQQIREISSSMTVRNPRFVKSRIRVDKARAVMPISNQSAITGSVKGKRFSGWEEQQTGKRRESKRGITTAARGGSIKSTVKSKFRANKKFKQARDFRSNRHTKFGQQVVAMIIDAREGAFEGPFMVQRGGGPGRLRNFKRGIYDGQSGKLKRIQNFEDRPDQPDTNQWHTRAIGKHNDRVNIRRIWASQIERELKFR